MAEYQFKLKGWQAAAAIVVIICVVIVRFSTLSEGKSDENLVKSLEIHLASDYLPGYVDELKSLYESGNTSGVDSLLETSKLDIISIHASYPIFKFSSTKEVVVKVVYSFGNTRGCCHFT